MYFGNKLSAAILLAAILSGILISSDLYGQSLDNNGITLKGRVYNDADRKPVDFASVIILEARKKTRSNAQGDYIISVPSPGEYTVIIRAAGLKLYKTKIKISRSSTRDFWIQPMKITSGVLTIVGERDIQKVSRYTLTAKELKEVPASLGDALNALTALPGVIKTGGFFGNLIIRGASGWSNRYYVDNMPLYNPLHFGGLHSVIANDLMSEIDLYSSAFPAQFGGPTGAVIDINTLDDVKEFGGVADIGLISSTALLKFPITKKVLKDENFVDENKGYVIVSGRYGYLSLFVPLIYELLFGDELTIVPEYWDYQVKAKYYFNSRHSLTLLAFGSKDYLRFVNNGSSSFDNDNVDPLLQEFQIRNEIMSFTQGLTYTYEPSRNLKNELLFYAALTESYIYTNIDSDQAASWTKGYNNRSKPYIYGLKDTIKFKWLKNMAELRIGAEVTLYDFIYKGYSFITNEYAGQGPPNFANEDEFYLKRLDNSIKNITIGGYIENKFTYKGLIITPGIHLNYLERSGHIIADPRLLISYEFETKTTLSAAGGLYSSFYQVNPYAFVSEQYIAEIGSDLEPEHAVHSTLGLEQKVYLFTIKAEGFYNYFWNKGEQSVYVDNTFDDIAEQMAYGAEFMLRLDRTQNTAGFFGWINYTYTQSKRKTNLPEIADAYGNTYVNYGSEQEHALKLVLGYTFKKHTISGRFQLYSSFPYTPITGSVESPPGSGRYVPTYDGVEPNSSHFPLNHRLDIRYTYKSPHNWGSVSWYVEIINVYNYVPLSRETWYYDRPYEKGVNPKLEREEGGISFIPNFGVEIKF